MLARGLVTVEEKQAQVAEISDKLQNSAGVVVVDYLGLNVSEVTELRKQLREAGVEMKVVKNTILRRAAASADIEGMDEFFTGPTAVAFSAEDVVAPAKILSKFAKDVEALTVKGGLVEGQVASKEVIDQVAQMPGREELLSMLLSVLQAPMRNTASVLQQMNPALKMAYALQAVAESK